MGGVEVSPADAETLDRWDELVAESRQGTPFHRRAAVEVLADHADADAYYLVGKKGQEVRGLMPVFVLRKGPLNTVFSPPPRLGVPGMGPVPTNVGKLKRKKRDRSLKQFVDGAVDWIDAQVDPAYVRLVTGCRFDDARPFTWRSFDATPRYTYEVDLTPGADAVFERFKSNLRSDIRRHEETNYDVFEAGPDALSFVLDEVRARYEAQNKTFGIADEYVHDLYDSLPAGKVRPYVGAVDGEWLGGVIVLEGQEELYYWQGGGKPDAPIPINDLIQWRVIRDAIERGFDRYDLVGANTHRIAEYKAKFNPDLVPYYEFERGSTVMSTVSTLYRKLV